MQDAHMSPWQVPHSDISPGRWPDNWQQIQNFALCAHSMRFALFSCGGEWYWMGFPPGSIHCTCMRCTCSASTFPCVLCSSFVFSSLMFIISVKVVLVKMAFVACSASWSPDQPGPAPELLGPASDQPGPAPELLGPASDQPGPAPELLGPASDQPGLAPGREVLYKRCHHFCPCQEQEGPQARGACSSFSHEAGPQQGLFRKKC